MICSGTKLGQRSDFWLKGAVLVHQRKKIQFKKFGAENQ
jgi:hypothetical protein